MGLLGNVAEVKDLRPRLMTTEFITVFADLLNSDSDGIEVMLTLFFFDSWAQNGTCCSDKLNNLGNVFVGKNL